MKRSTLFMGLTAAVFLFASCRDVIEEVSPGAVGNDGAEEYVYMSAEVKLPAGDNLGTRSSTEGEGWGGTDTPSDAVPDYEVGKDYENTVQTCLLVLTDQSDEFLAVAAVNGVKMGTVDGKPGFSSTAKFDRKLIKGLYDINEVTGNGPLKSEYDVNGVHVFAFCNPSDLLTRKLSAIAEAKLNGGDLGKVEWGGDRAEDKPTSTNVSDLTGFVEENPMRPGATLSTSNNMWARDRFMMSNASIKSIRLPEEENDWDHHASATTPFNLTGVNDKHEGSDEPVDNSPGGAIQVERLAARFDYRDASKDNIANGLGNNIYKVLGSIDSEAGAEGGVTNYVNIKLSRIGLVNMAKDIYYLRRVSDDGKNKTDNNNWLLCGPEYGFRYVVSPHASEKDGTTEASTANAWYNFPLFADAWTDETPGYNRAQWSMYNLGDVVKAGTEMDQWDNQSRYYIWRYCTENTIPAGGGATDRENPLQDNLFTTGIVFKGKLLAGQYLGYTRPGTIAGKQDVGTVPYMTYNVQRAILASTLGLNFDPVEGNLGDIENLKKAAAAENKNLENMKLFKPAKYDVNAEDGDVLKEAEKTISWDQINASVFSDMTSYPALYLFEGNLYAGFNEAAEYAYYDGKGGTLYQAMSDVMSHYYLDTTEPKKITVAGAEGQVDGYVQMTSAEVSAARSQGHILEQLTVEIFGEILGIAPRKTVEDPEKNYHDRAKYGVRWVDTGNNTAEETRRFKGWLTHGNSSFHFTLYDAEEEKDNYGGETSTSQGWGYYCYYFYWNRHNDNGIPGVMAPMEFAVVRNNVYKLAVTKINQLGHPTDTSNDPTPPTPHTDDETSEVYMKVEVEVLPWTVRVNEIQF